MAREIKVGLTEEVTLSWLLKYENEFARQRREELYFRQQDWHVQKHRVVKGCGLLDE